MLVCHGTCIAACLVLPFTLVNVYIFSGTVALMLTLNLAVNINFAASAEVHLCIERDQGMKLQDMRLKLLHQETCIVMVW